MSGGGGVNAGGGGVGNGRGDGAGAGGGAGRGADRVVSLWSPLPVRAEQVAGFGSLPGADEEPWDVMLQSMAMDEQTGLEGIASRFGLVYEAHPKTEESADVFYDRVPAGVARRHLVAGLRRDGRVMVVATSQPLQPSAFGMLERLLGMPVEVVLSPRAVVGGLINRGYEQRQDLVEEIVEDIPLDEAAMESAASSLASGTDLMTLARQTPVIRLVNMILFEALNRRASDVHIEPMEGALAIRFRVDGMLVDAFGPPASLGPAISSRLKVMSELDIANRHSPQDGQTTVRVGSRKIDIRLSCIPTVYGERLVLRLLDQSQTQLALDSLGMRAEMRGELERLIARPDGMILVTGPTGSGKTTTLYAALERVDRGVRNVMTIEDPVEYHLDRVAQMQVNVKRGVTFASGLRALLRQDPDVMLVGEIRDEETARLAVQASLTGHLVLSTLHTNDAPSALSRLQDVGVEPFLINSTLLAVLAQRLVRRLDPADPGSEGRWNFSGRVAVHELMVMTDGLRRLNAETADAVAIRAHAESEGFVPMLKDGMEKVRGGLTTEAELHRALG